MTDQELKDLVASLAIASKKTDEQFRKTDEQFKKTDEQFRKTDEQFYQTSTTLAGWRQLTWPVFRFDFKACFLR